MIRIVLKADVADQIRRADGQVEFVDGKAIRVGLVRRPPSQEEIQYAKSRISSTGPKPSIDELIAKVESL